MTTFISGLTSCEFELEYCILLEYLLSMYIDLLCIYFDKIIEENGIESFNIFLSC